ncbi:MAG: hypothetical protein JST49_01970 [Bacteroidetes bacterium]|nr:hypothetical protein [Bacteroidota bacterium]
MKISNTLTFLFIFFIGIIAKAQQATVDKTTYRIEFSNVAMDAKFKILRYSIKGLKNSEAEKVRKISGENRIFVAGGTIYTSKDSLYAKFLPIQYYRKNELALMQIIFDKDFPEAVTIIITYKKKED